MSGMAAKVTAAYFDSKDLRYSMTDDGKAILTGFGLENLDGIKMIIIFDPDDDSVHLATSGIAKYPDTKKNEVFELVNSLNRKFRWIKFVADVNENCITAEDDAVIQLDSCGEEVFELCMHFASIVDEAYPIIMKALFA